MDTKFVLGTTALLLSVAVSRAHADKQLAIWEKDADAQADAYGHVGFTNAATMDEYGDKLAEAGRWGFVHSCIDEVTDNLVKNTILWAMCADDFRALHTDKLKLSERELQQIDQWKKVGEKVETEAKSDPGIGSILKQAEAAKAEWKTFETKNHDAIVLYEKLKTGMRSNKSNDPSFDGCWDATQPAFAKLVRATKFHWDNDGDDAVKGRIDELTTTPAAYYTVANFAMCAYAAHASGGVLASEALRPAPGTEILGWRTMLIAKLLDQKFKPKFADRSLAWDGELGPTKIIRESGNPDIQVAWPGGSMKIQTGVVKKMKKDGDDTTVSFTGSIVEDCLNWKETGKIRTWDTAGDPVYERICTKRGKVVDDAPDDTTFGTKLTDGFAPGVGVAFIGGFAEECYNDKAKKFVSILGVTVKGSPAETPIKE